MKNISKLSISILCGLVLSTHLNAAKSNEQSLDRIVAIVNDAPITETELNNSIDTAKKQMAANGAPTPDNKTIQKQVMEQLINRKLELQLADQAGVKVDDAQLEKTIAHIAEQNKLTTAQLYEQLTQQGMSIPDYRKELREEIIIQQVQQQQVAAKITVTPQEVTDFMRSKPWQMSNNKEYHLEDILIGLPDSPTTQQIQEAKAHANTLLDKIHHGTSFHDASATESSGSQALQGGDLGWRKLPEIPSAFAEKVMQMKQNDIAEPIQTANGFHLIHLAGVRSVGKDTTSNKQVEMLLYQRKMEEAVQTWLAKTRSQAFINMNPEG